jgi:accessory colonization factor AcfC
MKKILLILMTVAMAARAESLCDMQIVMQTLEAHHYGSGKPGTPIDNAPTWEYNQPTFRVIVVITPDNFRPWATDFYFLSKKTTFTKAEAQAITEIISELPGAYSKEASATQIHFELESYGAPSPPDPVP